MNESEPLMISKKQKNVKKKFSFRNFLSGIFALIAIVALFYPIMANYIVSNQNRTTITQFNKEVSTLSESVIKAQLKEANAYNMYLYKMSQNLYYGPSKPDYYKILNINSNGIMGYISIPQISLRNVPIYHGDSEETLMLGIGHLPQTSFPVGGKNTHSVLSAHSGRANNTLFSDIQYLKKGDVFYVNTLNMKLKYRIIDRKIVMPDDVSILSIHKGKDEVTLVTCYPTGINSHRLLVTGERVPYSEKTVGETIQRNQFVYDFWVILGSILLTLIGLIWIIIKMIKKK